MPADTAQPVPWWKLRCNEKTVNLSMTRLLWSRRLMLASGFGGLILLMVLITTSAHQTLRRIASTNAEIRRAYLEREDLLDRLRIDLHRSETDLRDYLLDPDAAAADRRRVQIQSSWREMEAALDAYPHAVSTEEEEARRALQTELRDYWSALEPALRWDAATRRQAGDGFLRTRIFPRRQQIVRLSREITRMEERQTERAEKNVAEAFTLLDRNLMGGAVLAIIVGCMLAVATIGRILALERLSGIRYRQLADVRDDLRKFSERLVRAREEERRSLSRELHDEVGQSMSALLVELSGLEAATREDRARERMHRIRVLAESSLAVIRNMALLLRPSMLDDLGLVPALKWQAREISRRTGLQVKVAAEDVADDLPDDYRTCIYRVVQEALNNAARHAAAQLVRVTVMQNENQIRVAVADDGRGFDPREKGMGILGMEERVRLMQGVLRVDSGPGAGTIISILLPLSTVENAEVHQ